MFNRNHDANCPSYVSLLSEDSSKTRQEERGHVFQGKGNENLFYLSDNFNLNSVNQIKRFNDEVGCAPAPNHYDSKLPASKKSGFSVVKSARFEEIKEQTPGPGQYLTVQDGFVKPSPQALQRSASFRVSSAKRGSRTDLSRCVQMVSWSI